MVRNNHCELDKNTFVSWANKALDTSLTKKFKNGFRVTRIYITIQSQGHG